MVSAPSARLTTTSRDTKYPLEKREDGTVNFTTLRSASNGETSAAHGDERALADKAADFIEDKLLGGDDKIPFSGGMRYKEMTDERVNLSNMR